MYEYRCTRNGPYRAPTCSGHNNISCRQGYYLKAIDDADAYNKMQKKFPLDKEGFTVQLWQVVPAF